VLLPFGFSGGLGITSGGLVPVPGVAGAVMIAPAAHGSQHGPLFFDPHRDFRLSSRFGRSAMLFGQQCVGAGAHAGAHAGAGVHTGAGRHGGGGHGAGGHGAGAHAGAHVVVGAQPQDFLPKRDLMRSNSPGLELPQQLAGAGAQLPQPAPLTTIGAAGGGGGGAGSAPASAADDMIRNAAFTTATLRAGRETGSEATPETHRRLYEPFVKCP
jgi:hypothetical protein